MRPMSMWVAQAPRSFDGTTLEQVPSSVTASLHLPTRYERLRANQKVLYHQTSLDTAKAIVSTQQMWRGNNEKSLVGGAIYFAETPTDTYRKAKKSGAILQATVLLGNMKIVPYEGDNSLTLTKITNEGYDSVCALRNGKEYVVYHQDQVKDITIYHQ